MSSLSISQLSLSTSSGSGSISPIITPSISPSTTPTPPTPNKTKDFSPTLHILYSIIQQKLEEDKSVIIYVRNQAQTDAVGIIEANNTLEKINIRYKIMKQKREAIRKLEDTQNCVLTQLDTRTIYVVSDELDFNVSGSKDYILGHFSDTIKSTPSSKISPTVLFGLGYFESARIAILETWFAETSFFTEANPLIVPIIQESLKPCDVFGSTTNVYTYYNRVLRLYLYLSWILNSKKELKKVESEIWWVGTWYNPKTQGSASQCMNRLTTSVIFLLQKLRCVWKNINILEKSVTL